MTTKIPSPLFKKKELAIAAGIAALLAATYCFNDAWEARGEERPRVARWLFM